MKKKILSSGLIMAALLVMNGCGGGGSSSTSSTGTPLTQDQQIELAQTTLGELRTQTISIVDYNDSGTPGYLDNEALNLGNALESCSLNTEYTAQLLGNMTSYLFDMIENNNVHQVNDYTENGADWHEDVNCTIETRTCTYDITKDGVSTYTGSVVLPNYSADTNISTLTTLYAEFHGDVPTLDESGNLDGSQVFDLNLTITKTDTGADIEFTNISLAENSTLVGISAMSVSTVFDIVDDSIDFKNAKLNSVTFNGQCSNYTVIGTLRTTDYVQNAALLEGENENWLPSKLSFEGSLTNTTTDGRISGLVNVELKNATTITKDGESEVDVSVNGTLAIPARPEMNLGLTYSNAVATEATYHNFTASYSYDAFTINTVGVMDKEGDNGEITITANNGIEFKIIIVGGDIVEGNADNETGSIVTYNGTLIATLEYREELVIVKYLDGSFESLP